MNDAEPQQKKQRVESREDRITRALTPTMYMTSPADSRLRSKEILAALPKDDEEAADIVAMLTFHLSDPKNGLLRAKILDGGITAEQLVRMKEAELANPELQDARRAHAEESSKGKDITELRKAFSTGRAAGLVCPACHSRDANYTVKQLRSGDEPMTKVCYCNKCGVQWQEH